MQGRQWTKNGKNWRKSRHGSWRKSEKKRRSKKQRIRAQKFILRHWWISVTLRIWSSSLNIQSTKKGVVLRGDIVKDDPGSYAVFTEQGSSASQMTAAKSHGHYIKASRKFRTSSRCNIRSHSGQNGWGINVIENSKVRMSRYLDTSTETQMV